jgi:hypothetical protein
MTRMLYKLGGEHETNFLNESGDRVNINYAYTIVEDSQKVIEQYLNDGWFKTIDDALISKVSTKSDHVTETYPVKRGRKPNAVIKE